MPGLVTINCPKCRSKLRVDLDAATGKSAVCPLCEAKFLVQQKQPERPRQRRKQAASDWPELAATTPGDEDDYGYKGSGSHRYDEFGNVRTASNASKGRKPGRAKKRGMSAGLKVGLIVGGSLLGLLLMTGGVWLALALSGGGKSAVERAVVYVAHDSDAVMVFQVGRLANNPDMKELVNTLEEDRKLMELLRDSGLDSLEDVEVIAVGFGDIQHLNRPEDDFLIAIRSRKLFDQTEIRRDSKVVSHKGTEYLQPKSRIDRFTRSVAAYFPDSKTIVLGTEGRVRNSIERGKPDSISESRFQFVDFNQDVVFAYAPRSGSLIPQEMAGHPVGMPGAGNILSKDLRAFAAGGSLGSDIEMKFQLECGNSTDAREVANEIKSLLDQQRQNLGAFAPMAGLPAGDAFDSLRVSNSGAVVEATARIPKDVLDGARNQMRRGLSFPAGDPFQFKGFPSSPMRTRPRAPARNQPPFRSFR